MIVAMCEGGAPCFMPDEAEAFELAHLLLDTMVDKEAYSLGFVETWRLLTDRIRSLGYEELFRARHIPKKEGKPCANPNDASYRADVPSHAGGG